MPVSSGPQLNLTRTIVFAVVALAAGVGLLVLVVQLAGSGDVQFKIGDDVFEVGDADRFAELVDEERSPLLFSSLSRSRPIYVQHLGDDPDEGWSAIDARSPTDPDGCRTGLAWDVEAQRFRDTCGTETFPPDGEGLLQYGIEVDEEGQLVVDLNQDDDPDEPVSE